MDLTLEITTRAVLDIVLHLGLGILVFMVGRWLAGRVRRWLSLALPRTKLTPSLIGLIQILTYYGILLISAMAALALIGIPVEIILGAGAVVAVILGIALQSSISNLAATIIFLLFEPFKVGELVEANGVMGTVQEIQFFHTILHTADNRIISIPNSIINENNLINFTRMGTLRTELVCSISYGDDLRKAKRILVEILAEDDRVLNDPPAVVIVKALGENGVNLAVRAFTKAEHFWQVQFDLTERVKLHFDEAGITIPVPQRTVFLRTAGTIQAVSADAISSR